MVILEYIWQFFWSVVCGFFMFFAPSMALFGLVLVHFFDEKKLNDNSESFFAMLILTSVFFGLIYAISLFIYDDVTSLKIAFLVTVSVALIIRIIYTIIKKRKNKAED